MPSLENPKHEKFAQNIVAGMNQVVAYARAGYARNAGNASMLAADQGVVARIVELEEEKKQREMDAKNVNALYALDEEIEIDNIHKEGEVSREWIMKQLVEGVKLSREAGQFSASFKGLELLIRINNYMPDNPTKFKPGDKHRTALPPGATKALPPMLTSDQIKQLFGAVEQPPVPTVIVTEQMREERRAEMRAIREAEINK